jgi:hypothetical protein
MPVIKRQAPLLEEGEYAGQARKVTQEYTKPKINADGTKSEPIAIFRIPLHTHNGKQITTFARVMESTGWVFEQMCKSGNMTPPDGAEFTISCDDLENRVFYFAVEHNKLADGRTVANVKFHTKTYAIQQNPQLAAVTFPNAAPSITLRPAPSSAPPAPPEAESGEAAKVTPPPTAPAPGEAKPMSADDPDLSGMTEEEFREALEYAKSLRKAKAESPKAQAACPSNETRSGPSVWRNGPLWLTRIVNRCASVLVSMTRTT